MKKVMLCRTILFLTVIFILIAVTPLEIASNVDSAIKITASSAVIKFNQKSFNFSRFASDYPGEFLLAANLIPANNSFGFGLKKFSLVKFSTQNIKQTSVSFCPFIFLLVIMLFYIFYRSSGTTSDADPHLV